MKSLRTVEGQKAQPRSERKSAAGEFWDMTFGFVNGRVSKPLSRIYLSYESGCRASPGSPQNKRMENTIRCKTSRKVTPHDNQEAIDSYLTLAKASLLANKTDDTTYWREMPGHLRTLERWGKFAGPNRHVSTVTRDDLSFGSPLKPSVVKRIKDP